MPHIQHHMLCTNVYNLLMACTAPSLQYEIAHCDTRRAMRYAVCFVIGRKCADMTRESRPWHQLMANNINWYSADASKKQPQNAHPPARIVNFLLRAGWRRFCCERLKSINGIYILESHALREKTAPPPDHLIASSLLRKMFIGYQYNTVCQMSDVSRWKCHDFDRCGGFWAFTALGESLLANYLTIV